jgi:hypothetical protein
MLNCNTKMKNILHYLVVFCNISLIGHTMDEEIVEYSIKAQQPPKETERIANYVSFQEDINCVPHAACCFENLYETIEVRKDICGFQGSLRIDLHGQSEMNARCARISLVLQMGANPILARAKLTHQVSSLGLMEVTTWVKRRQRDIQAVTQVK